MDSDTQVVQSFLASMQSVQDALGDLLPQFYKRPGVKYARIYSLPITLSSDFGVSLELHSGAVVDFWIVMEFEATSWELRYSVMRSDPDEDGNHVEVEFPSQTITSVKDMPSILIAAIKALELASRDDSLYR